MTCAQHAGSSRSTFSFTSPKAAQAGWGQPKSVHRLSQPWRTFFRFPRRGPSDSPGPHTTWSVRLLRHTTTPVMAMVSRMGTAMSGMRISSGGSCQCCLSTEQFWKNRLWTPAMKLSAKGLGQ